MHHYVLYLVLVTMGLLAISSQITACTEERSCLTKKWCSTANLQEITQLVYVLLLQVKLTAGQHEAALINAMLPPAVLVGAEHSWHKVQADLDPVGVSPEPYTYIVSFIILVNIVHAMQTLTQVKL